MEFSKMRLQPLVKHRKTEHLLLELEQEHGVTGGGVIVGTEATLLFCDAVIDSKMTMEDHMNKFAEQIY